jgi:LAO/AO transport system kinase
MQGLSRDPLAFIRPSASRNILGGIANRTHEVMLLCEAAGYEVIIIETVGVGQSEVSVKNSVDFFLLLVLAGAGDELQGIKKGIMEMAHAIAITKVDGSNIQSANHAKASYQQALHLLPVSSSGWAPKIFSTSAHTGLGIHDAWKIILAYKEETAASGFFLRNRMLQNISWFNEYFNELLKADFQRFKHLRSEKIVFEDLVGDQKISAQQAAEKLLNHYHDAIKATA